MFLVKPTVPALQGKKPTSRQHRNTGGGMADESQELRDSGAGQGESLPEEALQDHLATAPAGPGERKLALGVVLVSALFFVGFAPFAKQPLGQFWAFIPIYASALVINDLITALLLFGQYGILRSRGLLVLACAYLFTALITVVHALSFPGLFAPQGLFGAGAQSTAWLYIFWHAGFPLMVIVYALLPRPAQSVSARPALSHVKEIRAVAIGVLAVGAVVLGLSVLVTAGHDLLPPVMVGNRAGPLLIFFVTATWCLTLVALAVMWQRRRPHSVLDLWLMVVLCTWLADVALSAMLNGGRFDLGFYAGRIYGLLAGSFVLMVLLFDNGRLYARLVTAHENEREALKRELARAGELRAANEELNAFSWSVSHDLRAPLRTVDGFARILEEDYSDKLDAEGRRLLGVVRDGSRKMTRLIDDLLDFSRLGRAPVVTHAASLEQLVRAVIEDLRGDTLGRQVEFVVGDLGEADIDPVLMRHALANLIGNAIKYTRRTQQARIEVLRLETPQDPQPGQPGNAPVYAVRDNGAGFDMRYSSKLFGVFQRLHADHEYEGTGVGLAIVQRVISRHGGRIWAEAAPGEGARFYFTLRPDPQPQPAKTPPAQATPGQEKRDAHH
jgi:signal transduction histidine kinase